MSCKQWQCSPFSISYCCLDRIWSTGHQMRFKLIFMHLTSTTATQSWTAAEDQSKQTSESTTSHDLFYLHVLWLTSGSAQLPWLHHSECTAVNCFVCFKISFPWLLTPTILVSKCHVIQGNCEINIDVHSLFILVCKSSALLVFLQKIIVKVLWMCLEKGVHYIQHTWEILLAAFANDCELTCFAA